MNRLKQLLHYLIWIAVALILGIAYMRIVLGPNDEPSEGLMHLVDIAYDLALVHVGLRIGCVIAVLFVLIDLFYLKKKISNNFQGVLVRLVTIVLITTVVALTLYVF